MQSASKGRLSQLAALSPAWRQGLLFAGGLALGVAAAALIFSGLRDSSAPSRPQQTQVAAPVTKQVPVVVSQQEAACLVDPALPPASNQDGRFKLQTDLSASSSRDVAAFVNAGKQAASEKRPHDAEVAFLMACRVADKTRGPASAEAAEARYELGRHYASSATASGAAASERPELLRRAEVLYADSLQTFLGRYGDSHEKSRLAGDGLKGVWQTLAGAQVEAAATPTESETAAVQPSPTPPEVLVQASPTPPEVLAQAPLTPREPPAATPKRAPAIAPPPNPAANPRPGAASPRQVAPTSRPVAAPSRPPAAVTVQPLRQATGEASQARPSFDCSRARSASERRICADPELALLDQDLGRLHAQAKGVAPDARAFRRQSDQEWRRRETGCQGDRACLLDWYARRRNQLLNDIDDAR